MVGDENGDNPGRNSHFELITYSGMWLEGRTWLPIGHFNPEGQQSSWQPEYW